MSAFPIDDWQFWIATLLVVVALWFVVRPMLPRRGKNPACPNCSSTAVQSPPQTRRTELTMEGTKIRTL